MSVMNSRVERLLGLTSATCGVSVIALAAPSLAWWGIVGAFLFTFGLGLYVPRETR